MPETSIERFLGDQVRRLQLTKPMLDELERTTGMGILALYGGVLHRTARHRDLTEILRCALIGGGTAPQEAASLVAIYIDPSPILPVLTLVLEILDAAFEGVEPPPEEPASPLADVAEVAKSVRADIAAATAVLRDVAGIDRRRNGPVHLDLDAEEAARADPASFTEHVRRRLRRYLKAEFGRTVDYWFGVDISDEGRPHLHGGIAVSSNEAEALGRALARAGGEWGSVRGVKHQTQVGDRMDDDWASYATKKITRSRQEVFGSMISVTDSIRRAAKDTFEQERKFVLSVTKEEKISHY